MDQRQTNVTDSDMTGIFDDPTFDSLPLNSYGATASPFDRNAYLDPTTNDHIFDDLPLKSDFGYLDPMNALDTVTESPHRRPSAFHLQSHDSSTSARSSLHDSSPDSRAAHEADSESPPGTNPKDASLISFTQNPTKNPFLAHDYRQPQDWSTLNNELHPAVTNGPYSGPNSAFANLGPHDPHSTIFSATPLSGNGAEYMSVFADTVQSATMAGSDFIYQPVHHTGQRSTSLNLDPTAPTAAFTAPMQGSNMDDLFSGDAMWQPLAQTTGPWNNPLAPSAYVPGNGLGLVSPSPDVSRVAQPAFTGQIANSPGSIPMHIAPIAAKSRVETQINIRITLESLPDGVKYVHFPTHTIAKSKLLAPDYKPSAETLELLCMVVTTSAMHNPTLREKAMRIAIDLDNDAVQHKAATRERTGDNKACVNEDTPAEGGEVRVCSNCISRERKRASRKKLKKEEEQAHWERYETERIAVFNTNEHKEWQEWQATEQPKDGNLPLGPIDRAPPTDTAVQVVAPMRIACYCRHQAEREGFQVIFTLKDFAGNVVAQGITDSILITDDHKAPIGERNDEESSFNDGDTLSRNESHTALASMASSSALQELTGSQSMVNLGAFARQGPASRSTPNLEALAKARGSAGRKNPRRIDTHSGLISGTITPKVLSRHVSPDTLAQSGPSKKRKSMSGGAKHRRVSSGLTMTTRVEKPRVDKSQHRQSLTMNTNNVAPLTPLTGVSMPGSTQGTASPFSPVPASFASHGHCVTQPPTPSELSPFPYDGGPSRVHSMDQINMQAFVSAPTSAHASRAGSPIIGAHAPSLGAFGRKASHGVMRTSSLALGATPAPSAVAPIVRANEESVIPIIDKITPSEGATTGGVEVSIYGQNFMPGMTVMFGNLPAAQTTYWGERAMCCVLPASTQPGPVAVKIISAPSTHGPGQDMSRYGSAQVFRYTCDNNMDVRLMEMALRFYSLETTGDPERWWDGAQTAASAFIQRGSGSGAGGGGIGNDHINGADDASSTPLSMFGPP